MSAENHDHQGEPLNRFSVQFEWENAPSRAQIMAGFEVFLLILGAMAEETGKTKIRISYEETAKEEPVGTGRKHK